MALPTAPDMQPFNFLAGLQQAPARAPIEVSYKKPGKFDQNCLACADGKDRLKTIGRAGVVSYRKRLAGVRDAARVRAMALSRKKRGRG